MYLYRTFGIPLITKKEGEKSMERGAILAAYSEDMAVVLWKDNKPVFLPSNCFAVEPVGNVSRYFAAAKGRKDVPCPKVISEYNPNMGGVDLLNNGEKNYTIQTRVRKWYWAMYSWFLNVSMVQAWRLWRIHKKEENRLARQQEQLDRETKEEEWQNRANELKAKLAREKERTALSEEEWEVVAKRRLTAHKAMLAKEKDEWEVDAKLAEKERKMTEEMPLVDFIQMWCR